MGTTRTVHYSRVESVTYTVDQYAIEQAIRAHIAKTFDTETLAVGHWEFEWCEADEPSGMLVIEMTRRFEHETDGVPATLGDDQTPEQD